jgi:hypothetical protein
MLRAAGYATGGDVKQDKQIIRSAVRQHEVAQHGGKHSPLKLARGGSVKKPSTTVNVIVAPGGASGDAQSLRGSMQRGMHAAPMGAGAAPMMPPMAPPPPAPPPMNLGGPPLGMQPKPLGMGAPGGPQFKRGGKIPMKPMAKGGGRRAGGGGVGPDLSKVTNEPVGGNLKRWLRGEGPAPSATAPKARKNASASDRYTVAEEGGISKSNEPLGGYRGAKYDAMEEGAMRSYRGTLSPQDKGAAPVTGARRASPSEGALTGRGRTAASRSPGIEFGEGALTGSGRAAPAVRSAPRPAPRVSRPTAGEMEADRLTDKWNTKDGILPGGIVPKDDVLRRGGRVKKGAK